MFNVVVLVVVLWLVVVWVWVVVFVVVVKVFGKDVVVDDVLGLFWYLEVGCIDGLVIVVDVFVVGG